MQFKFLMSSAVYAVLNLIWEKLKQYGLGPGGLTKDKPLLLNWVNESVRVLGIFISFNDKGNNKKNVLSKIDNLNTKLDIWRSRKLSLFGKCLIVKSLGISQFVYSASMLDVNAEDTSRIKKSLFNFIWNKKQNKIKRDVMC